MGISKQKQKYPLCKSITSLFGGKESKGKQKKTFWVLYLSQNETVWKNPIQMREKVAWGSLKWSISETVVL